MLIPCRLRVLGLVAASALAVQYACGCAVSMREDGSAVLGFVVEEGSAQGVGDSVGAALGVFGIPGGPQIGEAVGGILGLLGLGGMGVAARRASQHAARAAELVGKEAGWNEREAAASAQMPLPGAAA